MNGRLHFWSTHRTANIVTISHITIFLSFFMANIDPNQLKRNILSDMRVELKEEFDRNFERKAFFTRKWKPRRNIFCPITFDKSI